MIHSHCPHYLDLRTEGTAKQEQAVAVPCWILPFLVLVPAVPSRSSSPFCEVTRWRPSASSTDPISPPAQRATQQQYHMCRVFGRTNHRFLQGGTAAAMRPREHKTMPHSSGLSSPSNFRGTDPAGRRRVLMARMGEGVGVDLSPVIDALLQEEGCQVSSDTQSWKALA